MKKNVLILTILSIFLSVSFLNAQEKGNDKKESFLEKTYVVGFQNNQTPFFLELMKKSMPQGFQKSKPPRFVIMGKEHKFILGIGGFVNFRMGYDFNQVIQNKDFVTYNIPMTPTAATRQKFLMDASTSRLFVKLLTANSRMAGFEAYIEMDFRGGDNVLRLREAYVSYKGWLVGQTATTFTDLNAAPNTVDFEGPNSYTYGRNLMVRYSRQFKNISFGIAAEYPELSATFGTSDEKIPQRVPDFPMYFQYQWGKNNSHIRASGVLRDLVYYDNIGSTNRNAFGWGVQLSGNIFVTKRLQTYFQAVYGEGITPYIQDISGVGLDLIPNPRSLGVLQTLPMLGWFGGLGYNITKNISTSLTYSEVRIFDKNGAYNASQYKKAQYIVANVFWNIIPSCQVGVEYLYGTRQNMDNKTGHSNRVQASVQFNF